MELDIWKGDWGLPSVDLTCLQVMAYAKFSGAPIKLQKTNWPLSRYGHLPVFRHGSKVTLTTFDNIVSHLQKQNYTSDSDLTPKQCADIIAYTALLRDKLYPALLYIWWVDNLNYTELTRPWYAKVLALPLNYFLPGRQQWTAQRTINTIWNSDLIEDSQKENAIYKDAQECLNLLSHRLGDNDFFFGKSPCSLDAIVFGFLAPLLKAPFPNASLQNHLKACSNLSQFVQRILQKYFPISPEELEEQRKKEIMEKEDKQEFPNKWRNIVISGTFAIVVMLGYALTTGPPNSKELRVPTVPLNNLTKGLQFILMVDNAHLHRAQIVYKFPESGDFERLDWAVCSPDPIDHCVDALGRRWRSSTPSRFLDEFLFALLEEWDLLT